MPVCILRIDPWYILLQEPGELGTGYYGWASNVMLVKDEMDYQPQPACRTFDGGRIQVSANKIQQPEQYDCIDL